jgi:hypothetical protein
MEFSDMRLRNPPAVLRRGAASSAVICQLLISCSGQAGRNASINVSGVDYAFVAPDTVDPGPTTIRFSNRGDHRHELYVVRLKAGRSASEFAPLSGEQRRLLIEQSGGILLAESNQEAPFRLLVDLLPGSTYALLCFLRDAVNAPQHSTLGMSRSLHVRARK